MVDLNAARPAWTVTTLAEQAWLHPVPGERMLVLLGSSDVGGACTIIESVAEPLAGPPLHSHVLEDEVLHVLEGTLSFVCGGETFDASAGTTVTIRRGTPHAWQNRSATPTRCLLTFTPGGIDRLFEAMEGQPPEVVMRLAGEAGLTILGPPVGG